jgi:hypothetical protein
MITPNEIKLLAEKEYPNSNKNQMIFYRIYSLWQEDVYKDSIFIKNQLTDKIIKLGLIHDIVDKQNFKEDSDLHEIYKIINS